jgi:YD repeat-containing protein
VSACSGLDATYTALPASSTNALGQSETTGYTLTTGGGFGLWATATTDKNGRTTSYTYDLLGRMTSETLPGDPVQTTTWAYYD